MLLCGHKTCFFIPGAHKSMYYSKPMVFEIESRTLGTVMPEPGGPGGPLAPPIFGRSVNPIQTEEGRLSPPITTGNPKLFCPASGISVLVKSMKHIS